MAVFALALALVAVGINLSLTSRLDRIEGAFDGLSGRPAPAPGETILMIGTRPGGGVDLPWLPGQQSTESLMLVEVDQDGTSASVGSLPLLDGIGASAATSPPSNLVGTVESWSGRRVDHVVAIDWRTFAQLASDNEVDASYRYGSGPAAQHDYLRQVMESTLHAELRKQPINLYRALRVTADGTAIDDEWSVLELDLLLVHLRNLRSYEISFSMARPGQRA